MAERPIPFPTADCGCQIGFFHFHGTCLERANKMFTAAEMALADRAWGFLPERMRR